METLWQDLRYGARQLLRSPGFTAVAVLTLALGIGANTAIFSVVNGVLLQPLPYHQPENLAMIWNTWTGAGRGTISWTEYLDYKQRARSFDDLAAHSSTASMNIAFGDGEPEQVWRVFVTPNLFPVLGVRAAVGRTFVPEEGLPGSHPRMLLLSHSLWMRRFGGDASVAGKSFDLGGTLYTVIGVMPAEFEFPDKRVEIWRPIGGTFWANSGTGGGGQRRAALGLRVVGRLKPGVTPAQAQADVDRISQQFRQEFPTDYPQPNWQGLAVVSLRDQLVGSVQQALLILLGAVGFVLLIACANVANLVLVRAAHRQKEVVIRAALGAGHWRLTRQLLTENLLLAVMGGVVGVLLAFWSVDALMWLGAEQVPRLHKVGVDATVLGFVGLLTLVTGCLAGLAPAWHAAGPDLQVALRETGRASSSREGARGRNALVVFQLAAAVVLLAGAALLVRSFSQLLQVNPGFDAKNLATASLVLTHRRYQNNQELDLFFQQLQERLQALPGVETAAFINNPPFSGWLDDRQFEIEGRPPISPGVYPDEEMRLISPNYFGALGVGILQGRDFNSSDNRTGPPVAIVSESLARKYWGSESPVGKRIRPPGSDEVPWVTIVGVSGDVRHGGLDSDVRPIWYLPLSQVNEVGATILVRSSGDPAAALSAIRAQVRALDPQQAIRSLRTMEEVIAESMARRRFSLFLLSLFALMALALAAVGIYGVVSYSVSRRTQEFGIRMALGARGRDILQLVLGQGFRLAFAGVALGVAGALGLLRFLSTLLFGVPPTDPLTFAAVLLVLAGVVTLACYLPARRAARVDPMVALRYE
ncbi:MAG: ABC transporter permease [Acidobacteria bacterium]|nr:ABC transporter permease [Acidobacteriota bacterium]